MLGNVEDKERVLNLKDKLKSFGKRLMEHREPLDSESEKTLTIETSESSCWSTRIVSEDLAKVELPPGQSCAAWVAMNLVGFYNDLASIWGNNRANKGLAKLGPGEGFPRGVEYVWREGGECSKLLSAPEYVDKVLAWSHEKLNDESQFPDPYKVNDPKTLAMLRSPKFAALCGKIFRRLLRVFGIVYACLYQHLEHDDEKTLVDSSRKHFLYFCFEFGLLPEQELESLKTVVAPIRLHYFDDKAENRFLWGNTRCIE